MTASKTGNSETEDSSNLDKITSKFPGMEINQGSYGKSISQIIYEFSEPLIQKNINSQEDTINMIRFAVVAWNLAVTIKKEPNSSKIELMEKMFPNFDQSEREKLQVDVYNLIKRKEKLFQDDDFLIADIDVSFVKEGLSIKASAFI